MKRSSSTAELSSEQESLDAVEPTHADLGLESYEVQGQRDVGEGSTQAAHGALPLPMRARAELESCRVLDVEMDTTQGNSGIAVPPMSQAGLGLESHSSQEQPEGEKVAIQSDSGVGVQLAQVGSSIESQNFQEQSNVEEGAIQPISNIVVQPMQANLGYEHQSLPEQPSAKGREAQLDLEPESCSFQDVLTGTLQANRGVAAQRTEAGLGRESHTSQEQPNVEDSAIHAGRDVAVQLTQAGSPLESHNFEEQPNVEEGCTHSTLGAIFMRPVQTGLRLESQNLQEQPDIEDSGGVGGLQPTQGALVGPLIRGNNTMQTLTDEQVRLIVKLAHSVSCNTSDAGDVQAGIAHPVLEETGSTEGSVPQTPTSDTDDQGGGQGETSHQEEEAGIQDRLEEEVSPNDMENLRRVGWPIELADLHELMEGEGIVIQAQASEQEMQGLPVDDEADSGIRVQEGQLVQRTKCMLDTDEALICMEDIYNTFQELTEEEVGAQIEEFVQSMFSQGINNPRHVQAGASNPEEETGSLDRNVPQLTGEEIDAQFEEFVQFVFSQETNNPRHVQAGASHPEEETGSPNENMPQLTEEEINAQFEEFIQFMFSQGTNNPRHVQAGASHPEEETGSHDGNMPQLTEEEIDAQFEECVRSIFSQGTNNPRHVQAGTSHPEEETGSHDGYVPQISSSIREDLRNCPGETSHLEEGGLNDRFEQQASPVHMNKPMDDEEDIAIHASAGEQQVQDLDEPMDDEEDSGIQVRAGQQQMQDVPPQKGTAGRRMRLQVPLYCGAEGSVEQSEFGLPSVSKLAWLVKCI